MGFIRGFLTGKCNLKSHQRSRRTPSHVLCFYHQSSIITHAQNAVPRWKLFSSNTVIVFL